MGSVVIVAAAVAVAAKTPALPARAAAVPIDFPIVHKRPAQLWSGKFNSEGVKIAK
jgi:hypothetical protein